MENEEILNDEIVEQAETVTEEETPKPNPKDILKKHNLETRWKTEDAFELVDEMGKSYVNAERALRDREAELAQLRNIYQQQAQLINQQQARPKQYEPNADPEVEQARKFILEQVNPIIQEQLTPLQQQNNLLNAKLYVLERFADSTQGDFKQAVESGELAQELQAGNLPFQADAIDYAFNRLMYRKTQDYVARAREQARSEGAINEQTKQKAFLETGGKSGKPAVLDSDAIVKATRNMSEAEFDAYCKKNGIKIPT